MTAGTELRALLRDLAPSLHPEPFVFASVHRVPEDATPVAMVAEEEGLTVVLSQADAERLALPHQFPAAMITLRVRSALDSVGLTAAVAGVLADAGISCNVMAGYHHDHLFVPFELRREAMSALLRLAGQQ